MADDVADASTFSELPRITPAGCIVVAPEHRKCGIGRVQLNHLRAEATRQGRIQLIADAYQPLDPAVPDPRGRFAAAAEAEPVDEALGRLVPSRTLESNVSTEMRDK